MLSSLYKTVCGNGMGVKPGHGLNVRYHTTITRPWTSYCYGRPSLHMAAPTLSAWH